MALTDFIRSLFGAAPPRVEATPPEVPQPPRAPRAPARPPRTDEASSTARPKRVTFLEVLQSTGPFLPEEAVAFGSELIRLALLEPGPARLVGVTPRMLFFTHDGALGGAEASHRFEWMAPEVIRGEARTERSDVFVVGIAMYSALLGDRAIALGDSDFDVLQRTMQVELTPFTTPPPRELEAVVLRCVDAQPRARFASLEALATELQKFSRDPARLRRRVEAAWEALGRVPAPPVASALAPLETEAQLLARIRAGDEQARAVYADHLEATGRVAEAGWVRLEQRLRREQGAAQLETLKELRALSVTPAFAASVSRAELDTCAISFGFRCPRTWDALGLTEDPLVRWCTACEERVHFASDLETAERLTLQGRCVAVADSVARGEPLLERFNSSGYVGQAPLRRDARKR